MPVEIHEDTLHAILAAVEKDYGGTTRWGANYPSVHRIPTGSLDFDYATCGGIPMGRMSRFYGGPSSGKSLSCWNIIANAQRVGLKCAYYNAEGQFDPDYTARCGVDINDLLIVDGAIIEEIGTKLSALLGAFHVHVIDSLSACVTLSDMERSLEVEPPMALNARAWNRTLRHVNEHMDKAKHTIILVDQIRDVIGGPPGQAPRPPGGRLIEHFSSMTCYFKKGQWLFYGEDGELTPNGEKSNSLSGAVEADGIETTVRVEKSRVSRFGRSARLRYDLDRCTYDLTDEYIRAAMYFGVVENTSKGRYLATDGTKLHGAPAVRKWIFENPEVKELIKLKVQESW